MALIFMDGVNHYSTPAQAALKGYTGVNMNVVVGGGRFGANAMQDSQGSGGGSATVTLMLPSTCMTFFHGSAYKFLRGFIGFAPGSAIWFRSYTDVQQFCMGVNSSGNIVVYNSAGTLVGTGTAVLNSTTWAYIEVGCVCSATVGTITVKVNGLTDISVTGVNTGTLGVRKIVSSGDYWNNGAYQRCDLYVCDGTGPAPTNTFLGDCVVETIYPTGAGAETQWTPSTGANWENVDDATPDGDTTYNASNTVGQTDTYTMAGLTSASGLIYGVQKMEYARKDNAGTRSIAPVLRISGTDHVGVSTNLGGSYDYVREIEEVSPASGVAFTIAEVNAMEVGVQVTA